MTRVRLGVRRSAGQFADGSGQVPADEHYRPADDPDVSCATCSYYKSGHCTMFDADVSPSYVCDSWDRIKADHSTHASRTASHNDVLDRAQTDTDRLEEDLVKELTPILEKAGRDAAAAFRRHATDHLTASAELALAARYGPVRARELVRARLEAAGGFSPASTMVAVKPRPQEAETLAAPTGTDPSTLHVTLAYLGETDGPLEDVAALFSTIGGTHGPLEGTVGGVGAFADNGKGHPIILLPSVPGLVELRVAITQALAENEVDYGRQYGFQPHMTVDYADPAAGTDYSGTFEVVGEPLHFDSILVVRGDTEIVEVPLTGTAPLTASSVVEETHRRLAARGILDEPTDDPFLENLARMLDRTTDGTIGRLHFPIVASVAEPGEDQDHGGSGSNDDEGDDEIRKAIARVAADHQENASGYGETAWNAKTKTVLRVVGDWTDCDDGEADFLAIDGVENYEHEHEGLPDGWWEAEVVHPDDPPRWVTQKQTHTTCSGRRVVLRADGGNPPNQPPPWSAPYPNELLDVDALVALLKAKTAATRQFMVENVIRETLEGVGIAFDVTNPLVSKLVADSGSQIREIAETTQLNVMKIVGASYQAGLSIPNTAKAIRVGMQEAAPWRARMIARTELARSVHGSSLEAVKVVAKATGDSYNKTWRTAPGAAHPRHELYDGLDGQTVPLEQPFTVGDSQLMYPGDGSGDPAETINCRCTMTYATPGGGEEEVDAE